MRPVKGHVSLPDEPARRTSRRDGATFDAHRRRSKNILQSNERRRRARGGDGPLNKHRVSKPFGLRIIDGDGKDHSGALGEVARPLSVSRCQPTPLASVQLELAAAGPQMTGKPSEPFGPTW